MAPRLRSSVLALGIALVPAAAEASVAPSISFEAGWAASSTRSGSLTGDEVAHDSTPTFGLGISVGLGETPWSLGAHVETMSLKVPSADRERFGILELRVDLRLLRRSLPRSVVLAVGAGVGAVRGRGGVEAAAEAHLVLGYALGGGVTLLARGVYDVLQIPYDGACGTASPVAGCGYDARVVRGALGVAYAF